MTHQAERQDRVQRVHELVAVQSLGRHKEDLEGACPHTLEHRLRLLHRLAAPQHGGGEARGEALQLVAHERQQGGDDERHAGQEQGGELVAQRFAGACRMANASTCSVTARDVPVGMMARVDSPRKTACTASSCRPRKLPCPHTRCSTSRSLSGVGSRTTASQSMPSGGTARGRGGAAGAAGGGRAPCRGCGAAVPGVPCSSASCAGDCAAPHAYRSSTHRVQVDDVGAVSCPMAWLHASEAHVAGVGAASAAILRMSHMVRHVCNAVHKCMTTSVMSCPCPAILSPTRGWLPKRPLFRRVVLAERDRNVRLPKLRFWGQHVSCRWRCTPRTLLALLRTKF